MPVPARHARAPVSGIGGQQCAHHGGAELEQPGTPDRLGGGQAAAGAAQRPRGLRCQAA